MKKQLLKVSAILSIATCLSTQNLFAQGDATQIIKGGLTDANALMGAYAGPLLKSLGVGLNAGWFNTAKPHGIGGFDVTVCANLIFIPSADQSFDVNALGMKDIRLMPNEKNISPTFFGSTGAGPQVGVYGKSPLTNQDTLQTKFNLPEGKGFPYSAMPTAQLCVGVGAGTDIAIRFLPSISVGPINAGMFGFAVKHDFKQWIPGMKEMPFDLSVMFGYTSLNASLKVDQIQGDSSTNTTYNPNPNKNYTNQKMEFESNGWTTNVLISKKLLFFTPYLGLGYQYAKTTLNVNGDFPITVINPGYDPTKPSSDPNSHYKIVQEVSNPVSISGIVSGFRTTVGFRLKFTILTIHADYTFAEYNVATIGFGLNMQSIVPPKM